MLKFRHEIPLFGQGACLEIEDKTVEIPLSVFSKLRDPGTLLGLTTPCFHQVLLSKILKNLLGILHGKKNHSQLRISHMHAIIVEAHSNLEVALPQFVVKQDPEWLSSCLRLHR